MTTPKKIKIEDFDRLVSSTPQIASLSNEHLVEPLTLAMFYFVENNWAEFMKWMRQGKVNFDKIDELAIYVTLFQMHKAVDWKVAAENGIGREKSEKPATSRVPKEPRNSP